MQKSQKAQKGQKGRKTNFKSRRRGRRAATPARLLPALRQTCPPRLRGFTMLSSPGHGQTARRFPGAILWTWCRRGRSAPLCAPLRAFCPLWYKLYPRTACARPGRLCGAVRTYKHIDIKEPRQAVNLSGVSCVITNASGGGCGASSSLQGVAPLRGHT